MSGREHPAREGLLAVELRHAERELPVLDLREGPFAPVVCEFREEGEWLRVELATMANPLGGVICAEIDLARGEWTGAGSNGRQPISRFIERFGARGVELGAWPVVALPVPVAPPEPPRAEAPARVVREAMWVEPARGQAAGEVGAEEPARERVVGASRVMKSKDGVWVFELEESGRWELTARGERRAYYFVRVVRAADGRVIADTRKSGHEGWVIGDEIQVSKPGDGDRWMAIDTVYGEYWWENVRGPLSAIEDIAKVAGEW